MTLIGGPPASRAAGRLLRRAVSPLVALLVILATVTLSVVQTLLPPAAQPTSVESSTFSSMRAMHQLERLEGPRPSGSSAHDRVRDYLIKEFKRLGLTVERQDGVAVDSAMGTPFSAGSMQNVIAFSTPPSQDTDTLLLVAHYDSVPNSPGANDNGSNLAVLLETARAVSSLPASKHRNVMFAAVDGEEIGHLGAKLLAEPAKDWGHVAGVLNLDDRGKGGLAVVIRQNEALGFVSLLGSRGATTKVTSASVAMMSLLPSGTDYDVFKDKGWRTIDMANFSRPLFYHTAEDSVGNVDPRSVQHTGDQVLALTSAWLSGESAGEEPSSNTNYFDVFGIFQVQVPYLALVVLSLAGLTLIAWTVLRKRAVAQFLRALGRMLSTALISGGLSAAMLPAVRLISNGRPAEVSEGDFVGMPWVVVVVLATVALTAVLSQRRVVRAPWIEALALAALGLALAALAIVLLPLTGYLLLLLSLPLAVGGAWQASGSAWRLIGRPTTVALAAVGFSLFAGTAALTVQAMTTMLLPIGALLVTLLVLAITVVVRLTCPPEVLIDWRPSLIATCVPPIAGTTALALLVLMLPKQQDLTTSTLFYCDDRADKQRFWATLDRVPGGDAAAAIGKAPQRRTLDACLPPGPIYLPDGHVEGQTGQGWGAPKSLAGVVAPVVTGQKAQGRVRRFAVAGAQNARLVSVWLEAKEGKQPPKVSSTKVNGRTVPPGPERWGWDRWALTYHSPPDSIEFELEVETADPLTLRVSTVFDEPRYVSAQRTDRSLPGATYLLTSTPFANALIVSDTFKFEEKG